jgi:hypothetical protein
VIGSFVVVVVTVTFAIKSKSIIVLLAVGLLFMAQYRKMTPPFHGSRRWGGGGWVNLENMSFGTRYMTRKHLLI